MKRYLLILLLFCSCYVPLKTRMESWVGADKHKLILQWGAPQYTNPDGNGGEIMTYSRSQTNHYSNYYGGITSQQVYEYRDFYVNSSGTIYLVRWGRR